MTKTTVRDSHIAIYNCEDFNAGNLSGRTTVDYGRRYGMLTGDALKSFLAALVCEDVFYVVYSYDTPIAWVDRAGNHHVPDVRYSVTTSRHQSKVRKAYSLSR